MCLKGFILLNLILIQDEISNYVLVMVYFGHLILRNLPALSLNSLITPMGVKVQHYLGQRFPNTNNQKYIGEF